MINKKDKQNIINKEKDNIMIDEDFRENDIIESKVNINNIKDNINNNNISNIINNI